MDESIPAGDPTGAFEEEIYQNEPVEGENAVHDDSELENEPDVDNEAVEQASAEYLGRWNRLVSTTNWEKGRIISAWRQALIDSDALNVQYNFTWWGSNLPPLTNGTEAYDEFRERPAWYQDP